MAATFAVLTARFQFDLEWILLVTGLAGLILLGTLVIVRFKRWHAEHAAAPTRLDDYRALMERGLIEPSEFERIANLLEQEVANDLPMSPEAPTGPPTESFPPPSGQSPAEAHNDPKGLQDPPGA